MLEKPSLLTRIVVGKLVGLCIGLVSFFLAPYFLSEANWLLRWGLLLWYTTLGAIIGVFGVITYHPVLDLPMPWWLRASLLGAWMNFVLTFFAFTEMQAMMVTMFGGGSPFWFVIEGAVFGLIIGYCATRLGGEGSETLTSEFER